MEAKQQLLSIIARIRDILRGRNTPSVTGEASVMHIITYFIARLFTRDRIAQLNSYYDTHLSPEDAFKMHVPDESTWDYMMSFYDGSNNSNMHMNMLAAFYTTKPRPSIVRSIISVIGYRGIQIETDHHLRQMYENEDDHPVDDNVYFVHTEICKLIKDFDIIEIGHQIDVIGEIWEDYIRTSSNSRDNGQFFTDRRIVTYMMELISPVLKDDGTPPYMVDPGMGTGGFISQYVKHFQHLGIDWSQYSDRIAGYDVNQFTAANAKANIFMQTENLFQHLTCHNSLTDSLPHDSYDIIMANPPFGLKGISKLVYSQKIRSLGIAKGNCAELLFLQLMMAHLAPNGQAAVILPDGSLGNSTSRQYIETRKYLLEHFEIMKIVKMKGEFFLNTSIKPSIVYFRNSGRPTTTVSFYEIVENPEHIAGNMTVSPVLETHIKDVPITEIDNKYSLLADKYAALQAAQIGVYPRMKLRDVIRLEKGIIVKKGQYAGTLYPIMGIGGETGRRSDTFNREGITFKVALQGGISLNTCVSRYNGKYLLTNLGATMHSTDPEMYCIDYVGYYLLQNKNLVYQRTYGTMQRRLNLDMFYDIEIEMPPLHVQQLIVYKLDELNDEKTLFESTIKRNLWGFLEHVNIKTYRCRNFVAFNDVFTVPTVRPTFTTSKMSGNGDVPFYNASANNPIGFHNQASFESDLTYFVFIKDGGSQNNIDSNNVGLGKFFRVTGKVAITSSSLICIPKCQNIAYINYLDSYLKMKAKEIRQLARYTISLGHINRDRLATFQIQIPSEEIMQKISDKYVQYNQFLETNKDYVNMLDECIHEIYPTFLNMSDEEIDHAIEDYNQRVEAAAAALAAEHHEVDEFEENDSQYERKDDR